MASAKPRKRPLVNTEPVDEFGAVKAGAFEDSAGQSHDLTYVPGFSELRRQRDIEMAEYRRGERLGKDVSTLPVNVRLVRANDVKGNPQGLNLMRSQSQGYRPITVADKGKPWFKDLPPGARVLADGSIMTGAGDALYAVAPAERVAQNMARKQRANESQLAALGEDAEGLAGVVSREAGATDPTISIS